MGKLDESIAEYKAALLEDRDHGIKMGLQAVEKAKVEKEARDYINPEIAEKHKLAGIALFTDGKYPAAIKEFDEGIKRHPTNTAIYGNRCAAYMKLMEYNTALKDADKCIDLDP